MDTPLPTPVTPEGLTKREYFAAIAMQGILAMMSGMVPTPFDNSMEVAQAAVAQANDLMFALEGPTEEEVDVFAPTSMP